MTAALLYYLPGLGRDVDKAALESRGLRHAFGRSFCASEAAKAPAELQAGVVVADSERLDLASIGYYPDRQTWIRCPQFDGAVGVYRDRHPTPEDLARPFIVPGYDVTLGDGHNWHIPAARVFEDIDGTPRCACNLPYTYDLDASGRFAPGTIMPMYAKLWDVATAVWMAVAGAEHVADEGLRLDFAGKADAALVALGANYRLAFPAEAALLGLFNDLVMSEILGAIIDLPKVREYAQKKTTHAES